MTTKIETLTEETRMILERYGSGVVVQCLRIIDAHAAERAALTEQVTQLTEVVAFLRRQNKADHDALSALRRSAEGKVLRLTEALAAAEKNQSDTERWRGWERDRAEAAEPRMRELEAQLLTARHRHEETRQQLATCTSELAALRERVADARRKLTCPHRSDTIRVKDALEALSVAADTKREADDCAHDLAWELELPVEMVLAALAAQGLHVVTAADKAVLDAMAGVSESALRTEAVDVEWITDDLAEPARAELARRGSAK